MKIKRAAPVLFVDRVEPTRDFFKAAGFLATVEVPDGDATGFALLERDGVQVMVETRGNANEAPELRALTEVSRHSVVFIEVDDVGAMIAALAAAKMIVARHKTFYGADEVSFQEPGGHVVTFAQFA